jgi:catechol 2,3-dioxygenase-like lactoylglutathione lyase family enzyme
MNDPVDTRPLVLGLHHIRVPVSDVMRSRDWYSTVFDFEPRLTLEEEEQIVGVVLIHDSGLTLGLHHDAARARALKGFCMIALNVGDAIDLDAWCAHLDTTATEHSSPAKGHIGWHVEISDPDGLVIQLHTNGHPTADEA